MIKYKKMTDELKLIELKLIDSINFDIFVI